MVLGLLLLIHDECVKFFKTYKTASVFTAFCVLALSFISWYLVFHHSLIYMLSDAYYYSSVAESLKNTNEFFYLTLDHALPVVSTQNGVVLFHYILMLFGINEIGLRLYLIALIAFISMVLSCYIIWKILVENLSVDKTTAGGILVAIIVNTQWYVNFLQPINDAFFLLTTYIAIYLYLSTTIKQSTRVILFIILALVVCHFRMQGIFIFLAAAIISLLEKDFRGVVFYSGLGVIAIFSVLVVSDIFISDTSGLVGMATLFKNHLTIDGLISSVIIMFKTTLPRLFVGTSYYSQYYYLIFLFVAYAVFKTLWDAFKTNNKKWKYITIFILLNLMFVVSFPSQDARYLLVIFPFLLWACFDRCLPQKPMRFLLIGYIALISTILVYRLLMPVDAIKLDKNVSLNFSVDYSLNKYNSQKFNEMMIDDYDLIAETFKGRVTYFLLGKPATSIEKLKKVNIVYAGSVVGLRRFKAQLKRRADIISIEDMGLEFNLRHSLEDDSRAYHLKVKYKN